MRRLSNKYLKKQQKEARQKKNFNKGVDKTRPEVKPIKKKGKKPVFV